MDVLPPALKAQTPFHPIERAGVRLILALTIVGAGLLFVRCGDREDFRLSRALDSPEAVARAVVQGLAAGNLDTLRNLAVTEAEFRDLVWPKLPASRPERNLPLDYVWKDHATKSDANLRARLGGWQDRGFTLVSLSFKGGTQDYGTFSIHRETVLVLKDRDGREQSGRLFGSIIEHKGRFKVFSYIVD